MDGQCANTPIPPTKAVSVENLVEDLDLRRYVDVRARCSWQSNRFSASGQALTIYVPSRSGSSSISTIRLVWLSSDGDLPPRERGRWLVPPNIPLHARAGPCSHGYRVRR